MDIIYIFAMMMFKRGHYDCYELYVVCLGAKDYDLGIKDIVYV